MIIWRGERRTLGPCVCLRKIQAHEIEQIIIGSGKRRTLGLCVSLRRIHAHEIEQILIGSVEKIEWIA
jgi:hypothetical protein